MELPATIGKYELLEFLGGGMSHVYRARDTVIDRAVVVKILTDDSCKDADAKARFLQEAKLAGGFQHENIVSVFDYGEFDGKPFIVMEYLKGEDLREAIRGSGLGSMNDRLRTSANSCASMLPSSAPGSHLCRCAAGSGRSRARRRAQAPPRGVAGSCAAPGVGTGRPYRPRGAQR